MGDANKLGLLLPLTSGQRSSISNRQKQGKNCGDVQGPWINRYCCGSRKISKKAMTAVPDPNLVPHWPEGQEPCVTKWQADFEGLSQQKPQLLCSLCYSHGKDAFRGEMQKLNASFTYCYTAQSHIYHRLWSIFFILPSKTPFLLLLCTAQPVPDQLCCSAPLLILTCCRYCGVNRPQH